MNFHRRMKGVGQTKMGDQTGTFEIYQNGNVNEKGRTAVCIVRKQQGWESLTISIKYTVKLRKQRRPPTPDEVSNLLPLFFEPWETPVQFIKFPVHKRESYTFWLSERTNQAFSNLPK